MSASKLMSFLFVNEKLSVKNHLQRSFGCITVFAGGITLAICLGMLYALAADSYSSAKNTIISQSKDNLKTVAQEISVSIDQQLRTVAESVCMTSALYSSILLPYSTFKNSDTLMSDQPSYKEFYFLDGCTTPDCPPDFGPLDGKSRLPPLSGFTEGSLSDTSTYLYSSSYNLAARNESLWSTVLNANPTVSHVIDGLVYQNSDFETMYSRGPNTTVMFYLASQVFRPYSSSVYDVVHRTYPGILKNVSNYDSSKRSWFTNAPVDDFYFYGPYKETFTKQLVITLSSRKVSTLSNSNINTVSAAVMLLTDLNTIVNSVTYTNEGFGALITYGSHQVLVWGNRTDVYNEDLQAFKTVTDFDSVLAGKIGTSETTISYTDSNGVDWVVAVTPFFSTTSYSSGVTSNSLMLLVFGKKSDIEHPLHALQQNINTTTDNVTNSTVIIVCSTIGVVMLLVCLFVWYITYPLAQMIDMSHEIVHIAAEDEDHKDYTGVLQRSFNNMSRSDEVGLLALDYYHIVCLLHNKNIEKKCTPKYPVNPFHFVLPDASAKLTWSGFYAAMQQKMSTYVTAVPAESSNRVVAVDEADSIGDDLDVLASLGTSNTNNQQGTYAPVNGSAMTNSPDAPDLAAIYVSTDGGVSGGLNPNYKAVSQEGEDVEAGGIEMESLRQVGPTPTFSARAHKSSFVQLPSLVKHVTYCASMKSQLNALCLLLLSGVIATMVVTVVELRHEGSGWMNESGDDLLNTQVTNLQSITDIKAVYVKNFFAQLSLDLLVGQSYFNELIDLNLTRSNFIAQQEYLSSYSADPNNPYYLRPNSLYDYSSYFVPSDAGCQYTGDDCRTTQHSNQTRLTSLFDVKLRSYYHANNHVSFMQFAVDSDGYTRYLPYTSSATYAQPTSCFIADTSYASCFTNYYNSACYSSSGSTSYPVYDPRCRPWYQLGAKAAAAVEEKRVDSAEVHFQYPRLSSSGAYVMTAVAPIVQHNSLYGVLSSNFLATTLSDSINSLKILHSGYVYLIDSSNTSIAILHPGASSICQFVSCAEDFSHSEYLKFHADVLVPLQNKDFDSVADEYTKNGKTWQLSYASVKYDSIDYTLIATVPHSEILKASTKIQHSIDTSVTGMIVAFVFAAVFFLAILVYFAIILVKSIVNPIHDLHAVLERVKGDDLTGSIPSEASSLDMKILMEAFTKFMVSLRFGSDTYARGNPNRALGVFTEALELYQMQKNLRGVGASLNNLAVVELTLQHHTKAIEFNQRAIENAKELLAAAKTEEEKKSLQRTLSDREGNLAVILLEQNKFGEAFAILERLLMEDKRNAYIKGCVVKQGTLGQYYLKQGEIKSAEKIFTSALEFVSKKDESVEWNKFEASTSLQIALFNMALLKQAQKVSNDLLVHAVLLCLCSTENVHTATTTKALILLRTVLSNMKHEEACKQVDLLAEQHAFNIHNDKGQVMRQSSGPKRVAFVIDYSGSMSGTKIRSAIENVNGIFDNHIHTYDSIMLVTFNQSVKIVLSLTSKDDESSIAIRNSINSVNQPNGSTAFYDAVHTTLGYLNPGNESDWIIALTDGEDNGSKQSIESLRIKLQRTKVNLIVMGIGSDVQSSLLESLTNCMTNSKGIYIAANGDKKSIDEAFAQVAMLIQGQLILEDM